MADFNLTASLKELLESILVQGTTPTTTKQATALMAKVTDREDYVAVVMTLPRAMMSQFLAAALEKEAAAGKSELSRFLFATKFEGVDLPPAEMSRVLALSCAVLAKLPLKANDPLSEEIYARRQELLRLCPANLIADLQVEEHAAGLLAHAVNSPTVILFEPILSLPVLATSVKSAELKQLIDLVRNALVLGKGVKAVEAGKALVAKFALNEALLIRKTNMIALNAVLRNSKEATYDAVRSALSLGSDAEVEDLVVGASNTGIIAASVNNPQRLISATFVVPLVFDEAEWKNLQTQVKQWGSAVDDVLKQYKNV